MYKPNNKKMLTVLISLAMIFSALAILSFAAEPAYAQTMSGTITYSPTTVTVGQVEQSTNYLPVIYASGGTFSSVATFYFFWSTTQTYGGILNNGASTYTTYAFSYSPTAGTTTFTNALLKPNPSYATSFTSVGATVTAGETLYLLASDSSTVSSGMSLMGSTSFLVSSYNPAITISPTTVPAGQATEVSSVTSDTFNPTATSATVYLAVDGSSPFSLGTIALKSGSVAANQYVTMPTNLPFGSYYIYAVDSASSETAGVAVALSESITVSPTSITGATSSTFTITGYGFPASATIAAGSPVELLIEPGLGTTATGTVTSSLTVSANGQVTIPVTGLSTSLKSSPGAYEIKITLTGTSATPNPVPFAYAIFVSTPGVSPTLSVFDIMGSSPTTSGPAGDLMEIFGTGFPASQSVTVYFGGLTYTGTSDANGFFEIVGSTVLVPNLPAGSYTVQATAQGLVATASFTITSVVSVEDSGFNSLSNEYVSSGSVVYIVVTGLSPYEPVDVADTGLAGYYSMTYLGEINYYYGIVTVNAGSFSASTELFYANGAGYLNISYAETPYPASTGNSYTITVGSESTGSFVALATGTTYYTVHSETDFYASATATYLGIGSAGSASPGTTITLTFVTSTGKTLVPSTYSTTPEGAGYAGPYSIYFDSSLMTIVQTSKTTFSSSATGTATVSFVVPASATQGVHTITVYGASSSSGQSSSSKVMYQNVEFLVSTASSSSPAVVVNSALSSTLGGTGTLSNPFTGYEDPAVGVSSADVYYMWFDIYGFAAGTNLITATYYDSSGAHSTTISTDANGATNFALGFPSASGNLPYLVEFTYTSSGNAVPTGSTWYYETVPAVSFVSGAPYTSGTGYAPQTDYYAYYGSTVSSGSSVDIYANSLLGQTTYDVYISTSSSFTSSDWLTSFVTSTAGDASPSITIPVTTATGTYYLDIVPTGTTATSASLYLTVEVSGNYYFPGEIVSFSWAIPRSGATAENTPYGGAAASNAYSSVSVTVFLNGSSFATVTPSYAVGNSYVYLNGSFNAPNQGVTSYWTVSYEWIQNYLSSSSALASGLAFIVDSGTAGTVSPTFLGLVQGNGALLTGISSSGLATIEAAINSTVSTSLSVPISKLNAAITSIDGAVATLKTTVGNISVDLSTINATVASIEAGQVLVQTELGSIMTSFASLNASIATFNGDVATINTTLGSVQTSVGSILTKVTENGNGIATVQTDLGTFTGTVTSVSGGLTSIQTALGTLQTNTSTIQKQTSQIPSPSTYSNLNIFLIVVIILVLVTLVLAFMSINTTNKMARKFEEQKKQ
jgi:hypothetical protein